MSVTTYTLGYTQETMSNLATAVTTVEKYGFSLVKSVFSQKVTRELLY